MVVLPFLVMYLVVRKGLIYTIAAYIYAYRLAFCSILPCVLHQIALRLAPKRLAFITKTHYILQQIAPKLLKMAVALNIYSFCRIHKPAPFCIKTNLRENRFFAASWAVGE